MDVPVRTPKSGEEARIVAAAYIMENGQQIARYVNWPEPLKYAHLQKPKHLEIDVSRDGRWVDISAEVPVKGLALECDDDDVAFDDNCIDIVPGEVVRVGVKGGSKSSVVKGRYLGMV